MRFNVVEKHNVDCKGGQVTVVPSSGDLMWNVSIETSKGMTVHTIFFRNIQGGCVAVSRQKIGVCRHEDLASQTRMTTLVVSETAPLLFELSLTLPMHLEPPTCISSAACKIL